MFTVKTLNTISDKGLRELDSNDIVLDNDAKAPDAIICRSADLHSYSFPDTLKGIARAGAGVNNIPVDKCSEDGIVVFNTPGANANAVKELAIAGLILSGRGISEGISWTRSLSKDDGDIAKLVEKEKKRFAGPEIAGKTIGILGLGAIGVMVANAACELGMSVIGYDPYISVNAAWGLRRDVQRAAGMEGLLSTCDYISIHVPLSDNTKGIMGSWALSHVKRGVRVLNLARGPLVDDEAMLEALDDGRVSRYVTDFPSSEIIGHESVIPIPHLGASTPESENNCAVMASRQLRDFLLTGNITNSVNFPECSMPASNEHRIVLSNRNVPNMVGQITQVLADGNVNISDMLNRHREEIAYNIIDLEQKIDNATIDRLRAINGVLNVRYIGKTASRR